MTMQRTGFIRVENGIPVGDAIVNINSYPSFALVGSPEQHPAGWPNLTDSQMIALGLYPAYSDDALPAAWQTYGNVTKTVTPGTRVDITRAFVSRPLVEIQAEKINLLHAMYLPPAEDPIASVQSEIGIAQRIVAGSGNALDTAALSSRAAAAGASVAIYAQRVVSAAQARERLLLDKSAAYIAARNSIMSAATAQAANAAGIAAAVPFGVNALKAPSLWSPFQATSNSGASTVTAGSGYLGTTRFARGNGAGMRGSFIKLADLGFVADGGDFTITLQVIDTDRIGPAGASDAFGVGSINADLVAHGPDMTQRIDLLAWQPILAPAVSTGFTIIETISTAGGANAIYIGASTTAASSNFLVDMKHIMVERA
jgi:hypothetical protein